MPDVIFIGGQKHGEEEWYSEPPAHLCAIKALHREISYTENPSVVDESHIYTQVDYTLRRFSVEGRIKFTYVNMDNSRFGQGAGDRGFADALFVLAGGRPPTCVVPNCGRPAPRLFIADEHGRLAGRWWKPGDEIRMCTHHAHDVYMATSIYGTDGYAEWLKPDANFDTLDAYDISNTSMDQERLVQSRGRVLRIKNPDES